MEKRWYEIDVDAMNDADKTVTQVLNEQRNGAIPETFYATWNGLISYLTRSYYPQLRETLITSLHIIPAISDLILSFTKPITL